MTNRRKLKRPGPEELATMQLTGTLAGLTRELQLANGSKADLAGTHMIAEVEPIRRWQAGIAQLLEYWDQTLRSTHPVYIILRDTSEPNPNRDERLERLCDSLALKLWIWDCHRQKWTKGGTKAQPTAAPTHPMLRHDGTEWQPPAKALKAYRGTREPYATWFSVFNNRRHQMQNA
jgi:hypothetical protein